MLPSKNLKNHTHSLQSIWDYFAKTFLRHILLLVYYFLWYYFYKNANIYLATVR